MDHPLPWLRYVDADDLESSDVDFDGMNVESTAGQKLGDVDGFVVDRDSGRPYYVAVDAGGWFKSKLFLLPIGHVAYDSARRHLVSDVGRERVERYPGFDRDEFEKLSDADLRRIDQETVASCCPDDTMTSSASDARFANREHYRSPDWWKSSYYRPDRADSTVIASTTTASSASMPSRAEVRAERDRDRDRELVTAQGGDTSPHLGGRAQPGDVIGIETGGESTHVGETSEDEDNRRRDAEKDAAKRARK